MRNKKTLLLVLPLLMLCMQCCHTVKGEVRDMAQKYLDATGRYDIDDACLYCTPETAKGLRNIQATLLTRVPKDSIEKNMPAKIKIKDIELTSDSTAVVTYHKHTPIADLDGTLDMVLLDGQWKAHIEGIFIPEAVKQASKGDTVHYNYNNFKPGDLKAVGNPYAPKNTEIEEK
jgi:hypothetical protein